MELWQVLLVIVASLLLMFFFIVWLPHRVHVMSIGFKYGWPHEKRSQIEKLFVERAITHVGYTGGSYDPNEEFCLIIAGPFGSHLRRGVGNDLRVDAESAPLPPAVAAAFEGYINHAADVVYLLWYEPFLEVLKRTIKRPIEIRVAAPMPTSLSIAVE